MNCFHWRARPPKNKVYGVCVVALKNLNIRVQNRKVFERTVANVVIRHSHRKRYFNVLNQIHYYTTPWIKLSKHKRWKGWVLLWSFPREPKVPMLTPLVVQHDHSRGFFGFRRLSSRISSARRLCRSASSSFAMSSSTFKYFKSKNSNQKVETSWQQTCEDQKHFKSPMYSDTSD